jgi:Kef-type K+ transport system membrane component KefB
MRKLGDIPCNSRLKLTWATFKPFLFPVIGSMISFREIPPSEFAKMLVIVFVSLMVKMLVAYFAAKAVGFDTAECTFISGLWTGKASCQVH